MSLLGLFACTPGDAAPNSAATQSPVAGNDAVTPADATQASRQVLGEVIKPTAPELFVFDKNFNVGAPALTVMGFYKDHMHGNAGWNPVGSWDELVKLLQSFSKIEQLTLFTHGDSGRIGMTLTGSTVAIGAAHNLSTDYLPLEQFTDLFNGVFPIVEEFTFEGCNVGVDLSELLKVKKAFQATRVIACNMFHGVYYAALPATFPNKRTRDDYMAWRSQVGPMPPAGSPYFLPGATDLSEFIGGESFQETEWEGYTQEVLAGWPSAPDRATCIPRLDAQDVPYNSREAETVGEFPIKDKLRMVVIED